LGFIKKLEEWDKKLEESKKRDKEKGAERLEKAKLKMEAYNEKQSTTEKSNESGFIVMLQALWLMVLSAPIFIVGIVVLIFAVFLGWELIKSIF
jgi:Flp pilus assembly protein TadB